MKLRNYIDFVPEYFKQKRFISESTNQANVVEGLIVSITSFPKRFRLLHINLSSILNQTVRAEKVILWLDKGEEKLLPKATLQLKELGLEIRTSPFDNLRSYKKLLPTLKELPEYNVITADDDIIYPRNWIEGLLAERKAHPKAIAAYVCRNIQFDDDRNLLSYNKWDRVPDQTNPPSNSLMGIGFAGIYYPKNSLPPEVFNIQLLKELCATGDDLWFKVMSILGDVPYIKTSSPFGKEIYIPGSQGVSLKKTNVRQDQNRINMENLLQHYNLKDKFFEEVKSEAECATMLKTTKIKTV